jgi:hypothetical protein
MKDAPVQDRLRTGEIQPDDVIIKGQRKNGKDFYVSFDTDEVRADYRSLGLDLASAEAKILETREKLAAKKAKEAAERAERETAYEAARAARWEKEKDTAIYGVVLCTTENGDSYGDLGWFWNTGEMYIACTAVPSQETLHGGFVENLTSPVVQEILSGGEIGKVGTGRYPLYAVTPKQAGVIFSEIAAHNAAIDAANNAKKMAEEEKQRERREREIAAIDAKMAEEWLILRSTEPLAASPWEFFHSIGAMATKDGKITIFTSYAKELGAPTTYDLRDEIKTLGAKWNAAEKTWELPSTDENWAKVEGFIHAHDKKGNPSEMGYIQCWECGAWFRGRECPVCGETEHM